MSNPSAENTHKERKYTKTEKAVIFGLACYFLILLTLNTWLLIDIVPAKTSDGEAGKIAPWFFKELLNLNELDKDIHLIYIVIFSGSLGGLIHGLASISKYVTSCKFQKKSVLFYIEKPFIGAAVALLAYVAFRGGIISATDSIDPFNPYGMSAISIAAGLLGDRTTKKIRDLVEVLFGFKEVKEDEEGTPSNTSTNRRESTSSTQ